jgi:hypothetical protein
MADVHMVPERVEAMAKAFDTAGDVLTTVAKVLEVQMMILKTTAFIGFVGGLAVERYLSIIQPRIEKLGKMCEEMSNDMRQAVRAWEITQR